MTSSMLVGRMVGVGVEGLIVGLSTGDSVMGKAEGSIVGLSVVGCTVGLATG